MLSTKALNKAQLYQCNLLKLTILFLVVVLSVHVEATQLNANLYSNTEYTSNANLSKNEDADDVIERVGLNVALKEERKRFNADATFDLSQEFYLNNTFSDQTQLTTGFGLFNFDIVEDFLDWRTSFTRTQVLSDSSEGDTPDNREERDTFRTGPNINYRINPVSILRLGANYIQVENSASQAADTKRLDGSASYIYQYNSVTTFSVNSNYDRVIEVKEGGIKRSNSDEHSEKVTFSLGLNRRFSNGSFNANLGVNEVQSGQSQTTSGNYFDIRFQREQVLFHNFVVSYSESISDTSIGFVNPNDYAELITQNPEFDVDNPSFEAVSRLDTITQKNLSLALNKSIDSFVYTFSTFWKRQDYDLLERDEQTYGVSLSFKQRIEEFWTAGANIKYSVQDFISEPLEGENVTSSAVFNTEYNWTKKFSTKGYAGFEQKSNNKNNNKEYNKIFLGVTLKFKLY